MSDNKFNWRDKSSTEQPEKDGKEGYSLSKIWIPANDRALSVGADDWQPVRDIRFNGVDKASFLGFCSALRLTDNQRQQLLIAYSRQYKNAFIVAGESNPSAMHIANNAANKWLRGGAQGFFIRE